MFYNKNHNEENGLTIIELIVAIGIFGLVSIMIFSIFVLSLQSQRRIIALRNAEDNTRFFIESMSREIRTGKDFSSTGSSLSFTNSKSESIIYRLNSGTVEKSSNGGLTYSAITGSGIVVDYLNFYLSGQAAGDKLQPRITIATGITSNIGNQRADLKIQTTVSERFLQN